MIFIKDLRYNKYIDTEVMREKSALLRLGWVVSRFTYENGGFRRSPSPLREPQADAVGASTDGEELRNRNQVDEPSERRL